MRTKIYKQTKDHILTIIKNNVPEKCEQGVPIHDAEPWPRTESKFLNGQHHQKTKTAINTSQHQNANRNQILRKTGSALSHCFLLPPILVRTTANPSLKCVFFGDFNVDPDGKNGFRDNPWSLILDSRAGGGLKSEEISWEEEQKERRALGCVSV